MVRVNSLTSPETQQSPDVLKLKRRSICKTAPDALFDLKTRKDLGEALTRGLQVTDKSRLQAGTMVDFGSFQTRDRTRKRIGNRMLGP